MSSLLAMENNLSPLSWTYHGDWRGAEGSNRSLSPYTACWLDLGLHRRASAWADRCAMVSLVTFHLCLCPGQSWCLSWWTILEDREDLPPQQHIFPGLNIGDHPGLVVAVYESERALCLGVWELNKFFFSVNPKKVGVLLISMDSKLKTPAQEETEKTICLCLNTDSFVISTLTTINTAQFKDGPLFFFLKKGSPCFYRKPIRFGLQTLRHTGDTSLQITSKREHTSSTLDTTANKLLPHRDIRK